MATPAFYSRKVHAEVEFTNTPVVLLLRPTAWPAAEGEGARATEELQLGPVQSRARHRSLIEPPRGDDVENANSESLLSIGLGIGDKAQIAVSAELAQKLGPTLTGSQPLVDAGWLPGGRLVGPEAAIFNVAHYTAVADLFDIVDEVDKVP